MGKPIRKRKVYLLVIAIILSIGYIGFAKTNNPSRPDESIGIQSTQNPQIDVPPQEISELEEKIASLRKEIDELKLRAKKLELDKRTAQQLLDISEKNLRAPLFFMTLVTFVIIAIGAGGAVAIFVVRRGVLERTETTNRQITKRHDELNAEFKKEQEEFSKHSQVEERAISHGLGRIYDIIGIDVFYKGRLTDAIAMGERAVKYIEQAFGKTPEDMYEMRVVAKLKSNLAYYYAATNRTDMSPVALEYAEIGLQIGEKFLDTDTIDTFLFVYKKFGMSREAQKKWISTYENHKDKLEQYDKLNDEEREEYKNYYNQIKKALPS